MTKKEVVPLNFTILGGDLRSVYLCRRLLQDGHKVQCFGLELSDAPHCCHCDTLYAALEDTDCVILPIPTADGTLLRTPYGCTPLPLEAVSRALPKNIPVFGSGKLPFPMTDLTAMECFAVGNAGLTAQAALLLILQNTQRSLLGQQILILGAGRIGILLGLQLRSLGAEVTLTSRRHECRAWCAAMGMGAVHTHRLSHILSMQDIVVNTIPAPVLDTADLALLPHNALLLELASLPGGFDATQAEALGLRTIIGRGLPGKYTPVGAADIIAETIYEELELSL